MRPAIIVPVVVLALLLTACGAGNGAASNAGGGNGGQPPPDIPALSAIAPSSAIAGTAALSLTLYGSNFENGATVKWNGTALTASWISAADMTATVPAAELATAGSANVTVTNPESAQDVSAAQKFTISATPAATTWVRSLTGITAPQNIVWDPGDGQLYVSASSSDPSTPNTIVAINPITGALGTPVAAGNNPDQLSLSSDFSYLWVGVDGDNSVQRFLLPGLTKDVSFPVPLDSTNAPQQAVSLQAAPVSPHTVAVVAGTIEDDPPGNGIYVFDDAVQRSTSVTGYRDGGPMIDWIQWGANDSTIYANQYTTIDAGGVATVNVTSSGASLGGYHGGQIGPAFSQYDRGTGLLFSNDAAFNPASGSLAGQFDFPDLGSIACTQDSSLHRYYCVAAVNYPTSFELWVFDSNTYALLDRVYLGTTSGKPISALTGEPTHLVRWGSAGLAVITSTGVYAGNGGIFLIDGAAVNPNAAPDVSSGASTWAYSSMSSLTPEDAAVGASDTVVTVSGNNFSPTSAACWNCSYIQFQFLPTTYISSQELEVTIPTSLLSSAKTLPISIFDSGTNLFSTSGLTFSVLPASTSTKVTAVDIAGFAMAWDGSSSLLYVGGADYDNGYPNSIAAIDAETGAVVNSQPVSADPDLLSISANGQYLYVGFRGATAMTQLQLPSLGSPRTWTLTNPLSSAVYWPGELKAAPQSPDTTAVTLFNFESEPFETGGVLVYDDDVPRPDYVNGWGPGPAPVAIYDTLAWGPSDQLLTGACFSDNCTSDTPISPLYEFHVSPSGPAYVAANPPSFSSGELHSDFGTGLIYSDDGLVANPSTQTIVGSYNASGLVTPDSSLNRVFILGQTAAQVNTHDYTIESFDETAFTPVSSITINNLVGFPIEMIRWGTSGLAILTDNLGPVIYFSGYTGSQGMLYLIQDANFVSNAQVAASKPQGSVQRRWKRITNADIVRRIQTKRLQARP